MCATGHLKRRNGAVWQILFCLTLLSFLFRSAVPVGYMPGVGGQYHQRLTITLCTMDGAYSVQLADLFTQAPHPSGHDGAHPFCPFCAVVSHAVAPGLAMFAAIPAAVPRFILRISAAVALPPAALIGPPLGSRAPPALLG